MDIMSTPTNPLLDAYLASQPSNVNFLNTTRFRLILRRAPSLVYFVQKCNLPGFSMGNPAQPTPFVDVPVPGDNIVYQDFYCTFPVDEDMKNYREIADWIVGLGFPKQFGQYADLVAGDGIEADIGLMILDSDHNAQHIVSFHGAFPFSMTEIAFDTQAQDITPPMVTATFKYAYWQFDEVNADTSTMTEADRGH
jgi:hypothetical protein